MKALKQNQSGISFFEVVLSVTLLGILSVAIIPLAMKYYNKVNFENTQREFVFNYKKARSYSKQKDQRWAILVNSDIASNARQAYSIYAGITDTGIDVTGITDGEVESKVILKGEIVFKLANDNERWIYDFNFGKLNIWFDNGGGTFVLKDSTVACNVSILQSGTSGIVYTINQLNASVQSDTCSDAACKNDCNAVVEACGNGILEPANSEFCDDWNTNNGDCCDSGCAIETDCSCDVSNNPSICLPYCVFNEEDFGACTFAACYDDIDCDNDGDDNDIDIDDDNDGILDGVDPDPLNPDVCGTAGDMDLCDDCSIGTDDLGSLSDSTPANDGC